MNRTLFLWVALGVFWIPGTSLADVFGSGANEFSIRFVRVDQPGNPPDTTDRPVTDGAVAYRYRIGKYEISERMIDKANALGGLGITHDGRGPDFPATSISWFEAARFVNWLNESKGSMPAYKFDEDDNFQLWEPDDDGYDADNLYRNRLARYFLPSLDEWHKAAYYDAVAGIYYDYPTGSDSVPDGINSAGDTSFDAVFFDGGSNGGPNNILNVGLLSPYGTAGQGGNVREWLETAFDRINNIASEHRQARGGSWSDGPNGLAAWNDGIGTNPQLASTIIGLRVTSIVPEPAAIILWGLGLVGLLRMRHRLTSRRFLCTSTVGCGVVPG